MQLEDAELPLLELAQPGMVGERLHETLAATRAESWIARNNSGVSILDREAAEFFLKSPALEFPGAVMMELMGITDGPIHRVMERGLLGRNGPDHKRLRRLVSRSFTPRAADRWRPVMREQLAELWASLDGAASFDAMETFARPFPSRMIALNVGAPLADADVLRHYSATVQQRLDVTALQTRRAEIETGTAEFESYVEQLVADHRVNPSDDLVTELIDTEVDGDRLDNDDVVSLIMAMLSGGIDTTENQLAHGLRLFAQHPVQWEALGNDPSLAKAAADEVLRFEPVSPFTVRIVRSEVTYRDIVFPPGTIVLVCTWSANREGRGDERPTDFDITADRGTDRLLSFGAGPHYCLGAGLAWAELEETFSFLAGRMADLRLDGDVEWGSPIGIYNIERLPLAFTPR
ncbi:MAG: cytochrome P450 [Candidatus Aldehydirespiratoraceae bacterium]|jgi:cytochrome P450